MQQTETGSSDRAVVARNAFFLLTAKAISTGLGFIQVVYLARMLGDVTYGKYVFAGAYTAFFTILGDLGLNNLTIRHLAREKGAAGRYLGTMVTLRSILGVISVILACLLFNILGYPPDTREVVYIVAASRLLVGTFGYLYIHVFEGYEQMQYITWLDSMKRAADLLMCVGVLSMGSGLVPLVLGFMVNEGLHLTAAGWIARNRLRIRIQPHINVGEWRPLITASLPFAMILMFMTILTATDVTMLEKMRSEAEVGWYGAANRLITALGLVPLMGASALFPTASRLHQTSFLKVRDLFRDLMRPMLLFCVPLAVGTTILAQPVILLLYGTDYAAAATALRILIWSAAVNFVTLPMIFLLTAIDRQRYATFAMGMGALVNVVSNFILIPRSGLTGASATTVLSQLVLLCCCLPVLLKQYPGLALHRYLFRPVLGSIVMGALVWQVAAYRYPVLPTICLGMLVYAGVLILTGGLKREDWRDVRRILKPEA